MSTVTTDINSLFDLVAPLEGAKTLNVCMDGTQGLVTFSLPPGWNVNLKEQEGEFITQAEMSMDGQTYSLTKEAILDICAHVGIPAAYVFKTPGALIATHLNYWATHSVDNDFKILTKATTALAVMKKNVVPFSNTQLLEQVIDSIGTTFGTDILVSAEQHTRHDLNLTSLRLSLPELSNTVHGDDWHSGIQLHNSLTGKQILSIAPLPNDQYDNSSARAMVSQHAYSSFNRKQMGQDWADVQAWIQNSVDDIGKEWTHDFDVLEGLPQEDLGADLSKVLADIFRVYAVPLRSRQNIIDTLAETGDKTYYGIINAITVNAGHDDLPDKHVTALLEVAGEVATSVSARCTSCMRVQV